MGLKASIWIYCRFNLFQGILTKTFFDTLFSIDFCRMGNNGILRIQCLDCSSFKNVDQYFSWIFEFSFWRNYGWNDLKATTEYIIIYSWNFLWSNFFGNNAGYLLRRNDLRALINIVHFHFINIHTSHFTYFIIHFKGRKILIKINNNKLSSHKRKSKNSEEIHVTKIHLFTFALCLFDNDNS